MKSFTAVAIVVLAFCALGSTKSIESHFADKDFLVKQKFIFEVLQHVYQDDVFVTKYDDSYYNYKPWEHVADYHHHEKLDHFFELWQHKPMHDDEIFSIFYEKHVEYALGLVRLFYYAKDWTTFTHAVFWARLHVNKPLFVYSLTIASLARKDMQGIVFPAVYEVLPHYFFDVNTIEAAEKFKMHGFHHVKKLDNIFNVVIKSNYTNVYGEYSDDNALAYFLEDIGLNAFYYYYNIDYPFWTKGDEDHVLNNDRRGEFYLYLHWQLLARYYLERLSADLDAVPYFDMYDYVDGGYFSNMRYYPGVGFPGRESEHFFYSKDTVKYIRDIEYYSQRIADFIDKNKDYTTDVINVLGNMIQGNADSVDHDYYGSIDKNYRWVFNSGRTYGKRHEILPNTLMHYETSIRDPAFFEIYKTIVSYYWRMMKKFPEYTTKDFVFDGVKIDKVHVPEKLTTYFEYFDADISNAVGVEVPTETTDDALIKFGRNSQHNGHSFVVKARQHRLNHKPFEFQLDVTSDKAQKAVVKFFIGPKHDTNGKDLDLEHNYMNFYELDHFLVDLNAGTNTIKRNSDDYSWYVHDRTTYFELYQKIMDATNTDYKFPLDQNEAHCGIPKRLMLPRGKEGGMYYQVFFMVYPYHANKVEQYSGFDPVFTCGVGSGARFIDALPFGFPFNRPVKHDYYFSVDNFVFHDVQIFHKSDDINVV